MEIITEKGIVLKEFPLGENDKFIHVLTQKYGVIEIYVRGGQKLNSKNSGSIQLFSYSLFSIKINKGKYYLDSSEPIQFFYSIREDLEKISLAYYFSEIICYAAGQHEQKEELIRLVLNTFYFLANGKRKYNILKSIFEMRFMSIIGMMPDILCCCKCMSYISETMCFDIKSTKIFCSSCYKAEFDGEQYMISASVVKALRHIVLADFNRLFNFSLSEKNMTVLQRITENYMLIHLGRKFKTLDFYKSLNQE